MLSLAPWRTISAKTVLLVPLLGLFGLTMAVASCSNPGEGPGTGTVTPGVGSGFDALLGQDGAVDAGQDSGKADDVQDAAVDPCAACPENSTCELVDGKASCPCNDGFKSNGGQCVKLKTCTDPDNKPKCALNAKCVEGEPGKDAICKCKDGLDGEPYDGGCTDNINECLLGTHNCGTGTTCFDLDPLKEGGNRFRCDCKPGFKVESAMTCYCSEADKKKPTADGNECVCIDGFVLDSATGKCVDGDVCKTITCGPNMVCVVGADKAPACECKSQFYMKQGGICIDKAECGTDNGGCGPASAFKCIEQDGAPPKCDDINECLVGTAVCDANANCNNSVGGYTCECKQGFTGSGKACVNVDECSNGTAACDLSADCSDTVGGYKCTCKAGFQGDGKTCEDKDECATDNGGCGSPKAFKCINKVGAGPSCEDVDECLSKSAGCAETATCTNTVGSFTCSCNKGWKGDGKTCTDVDECADGTASCGSNSFCYNTQGKYDCVCHKGYENDGKGCADINECAPGTNYCDANATCTNVPGDANCACKPGYKGDGFTCVVDKACNPTCDQNASCVGVDGQPYYCKCNPGFSGSGTKCFTVPFTVSMGTVTVQAFDPDDGMLWDSETLFPVDKKEEIDKMLAAALAAFVPGGAAFAKYVPLVTSLTNYIAGFTSAPDPAGLVKLTSATVKDKVWTVLPEKGNTYNPAWPGTAWSGVEVDNAIKLELYLKDVDSWFDDSISTVYLTFKHFSDVLKSYVDPQTGKISYGAPIPVPVGTQSKKGILFVELSLTPAYDCGNGKCENTSSPAESAVNCPQDCGTSVLCGNGSCDGGESPTSCPSDCKAESKCDDKVDNDNDGKIDCLDSDCGGSLACSAPAQCAADYALTCGDGDEWNNGNLGSTNAVGTYTCGGQTLSGETGAEYVYEYTATCTGKATVKVTKTQPNSDGKYLDLFVLEGAKPCGGTSCISHNLMNVQGNAAVTFDAVKSAKYFLVVDGYQGFAGSYKLETSCQCL